MLEESQEGSEWAIRIGDASPPAWGKKRSLSQDDTLEDDPKRRRLDSEYVSRFCHSIPSHPNQPSRFCVVTLVLNILHCLLTLSCLCSFENHVQVREIAAAFQFTPGEVGAYYSRVNQNVERTRRRFEKARKLLDGMSDVE